MQTSQNLQPKSPDKKRKQSSILILISLVVGIVGALLLVVPEMLVGQNPDPYSYAQFQAGLISVCGGISLIGLCVILFVIAAIESKREQTDSNKDKPPERFVV